MRGLWVMGFCVLALAATSARADPDSVRVKDLGHFLGWRENAVVGYGLVIGLSGSGDSPSSAVTRQALKNALSRLGANVAPDAVQSRNVAAVMVTAVLPPSTHVGDRIDVTVSSIGDARSLVGGTLLMTPLLGPDQHVYAIAQGQMVVGGYRFDSQQNRQQKNYPTSGVLPGGATVETAVDATLLNEKNELTYILEDGDSTTAERIKDGVNMALGVTAATVEDPDTISIDARYASGDLYRLIAEIEAVRVTPDAPARVVVNERSGTIVAGGAVQISSVVVAQGDLRVSVSVDNDALQPSLLAEGRADGRGRRLVVTNTKLDVDEVKDDTVAHFSNTTVADLAEALTRAHVDTRGVISILQAIKAAGALHADIVVQ
ncbi:MAG TPA: flagellar basal body P-ring protein FlgI [Caulobacteraceae bacterium]|jgi:flagellar P-ring protein precursor FlgI|nr:flagellar basal body P-ring protein FlgI [Caulobacteraceae bacterium]